VGVTRDIKVHALREEPRAYAYLAQAQQLANQPFMTASTLLVRTSIPPRTLLPSLERELRATAPEVPVFALGSLDDVLDELLMPQRIGAVLLGGFSVLAVLVAALGIFGVVAYGVSQRRREIGIRMALGAGSGAVLRLVLARDLVHVGAGIALGLALAAVATRITEGFLYGIRPTDLPTYVVTALLLLAASVLAAYLPARAATRTNPAITLQTD
jgi:putative ABC transport system permease protein